MPLQPFTFAKKSDIRLVVYGNTIYKIKLNCRQSSDRNRVHKLCLEEKNHKDLEKVICAVINADTVLPVLTDNFVIYPYKNHWETRERLLFTRDGKPLEAHQFAYTFYVEERETERLSVDGEQSDESVKEPEISKPSIYSAESVSSNQSSSPNNSTEQDQDGTDTRTAENISMNGTCRVVSDYGQKNRHDIEEKDLKEFLRLQQMASVDDEDLTEKVIELPVTGFQRVFSALVSPVKTLLGHQ